METKAYPTEGNKEGGRGGVEERKGGKDMCREGRSLLLQDVKVASLEEARKIEAHHLLTTTEVAT